jgi:hypothetical protein
MVQRPILTYKESSHGLRFLCTPLSHFSAWKLRTIKDIALEEKVARYDT